jgi:hypothetical protein
MISFIDHLFFFKSGGGGGGDGDAHHRVEVIYELL